MIVVLGSNGQVGFELTQQLKGAGIAHSELLTPKREQLDLTDLQKVSTYLLQHQPQIIINAAAYTQVDKAESEPALADLLNHQLPAVLADYTQQHNAYLLHYSTDYVYAGQGDHAQTEDAPLNPQSVYAKTKRAGEKAIQARTEHAATLRTCWVYSARGQNFMNTMLKLAQQRDALSIVNDQIGAPTSASFIAQITRAALDKRLTGIYNLAHGGETSWYGFAQAIFSEANALGLLTKVPSVTPISTAEYPTPAKRPLNSRLDCSALQEALGIADWPHWRTGLTNEMNRLKQQDVKHGSV